MSTGVRGTALLFWVLAGVFTDGGGGVAVVVVVIVVIRAVVMMVWVVAVRAAVAISQAIIVSV